MKRYWYFASTLPHFPFGAAPPMTVAEFDERCERLVDKGDLELITLAEQARAGLYQPSMQRSPFLRAYTQFEASLRNALALARAKAASWDPEPWLRTGIASSEVTQSVQTVLSAPDPLQAELTLERERWNTIDQLSALSSFELDAILGYKLKLLIATRCISFNRERGTEEFNTLYQDIIDAAADAAGTAQDTGVGP